MKKVVQTLLIALMPLLFVLGYFSFDGDAGNLNKPVSTGLSEKDIAGFVAGINSGMILIEGGKFNMGSELLSDNEKPVHEVEVDTFYMSKAMITVQQFSFFIRATGYKTNAEKDSGSFVFDGTSWAIHTGVNWECDELGHKQLMANNNKPVLHVSWYDANEFCLWLSKTSGKKYRLPTEAEWEFAAKGGIKSAGYTYSGSNDANEVSWNGTNSGIKVHDVCQKKSNELGLYDMCGNAWQWCNDWFDANYYNNSPVKNPQGPESGKEKICRGGSYLSGSGLKGDTGLKEQVNPAWRGKELPYLSASDGSFRVVSQ